MSNTLFENRSTFRFTVLTYRIGEIIELLVLILMWSAIYATGSGTIKGFTLNEMITYVLIGNLASVAVRNFLPGFVSRDINQGRLSMFLVKPISYIKYAFVNELGRAFLATVLSVLSMLLVILFFLDRIEVQTDFRYLGLAVGMVCAAMVIELQIGFLVGIVAFWSDEVEGIQSTIGRVARFFSGGYFPLTLLPAALVTASSYLPFQYSFFGPAMLYLGKMDLYAGLHGLAVQLVWMALLSMFISFMWRRGLRRYEAVGS